MLTSNDIANSIRKKAPEFLAESWDNVGLQIGSRNKGVKKVLLTLDVTAEVIEEAIEIGADMIVSHHPFIFQGLRRIDTDTEKGRLIQSILAHDLCIYSAHTNLDKAAFGLNDYIARKFGLNEKSPLKPDEDLKLYKIAVYVPTEDAEKIMKVLGEGGAGFTGERYSHCSFRVSGEGRFKPLEGSQPYLGQTGKIEKVMEEKIETIVEKKKLDELFPKLVEAHPYEDMAYDLFPIERAELEKQTGLGKIGTLPEPMSPDAFIERTKEVLNLSHLKTAGEPPEKIEKVAVCTGAGAEFIGLAKVKGADVYITGDLKYHDAQRAKENGLWVIDAGHFGTENQVVYLLEEMIREAYPQDSVETVLSQKNEDFFRNY